MIIPIMIVRGVMVIVIELKISKILEAIRILRIVKIRPISEDSIPKITVAIYLPIINSLGFTGKVKRVSRVPFSFSTAVAEVAIFVDDKTIDIIIYVKEIEKIISKIKFSPSRFLMLYLKLS